ncbi:PREDICTED: uncharacterized protein LOC109160900 isoform X2 [Ipomoea nil]|uniref:uncharacterized protein LOC109160900 isoform X2 n=1 Tax=Ipomoea nil TaxID=35883 RepID=UPI0009011B9E|nr:PREDICTED: uncharacterized protein LOC109160900 isoform X2 [Ipomoea nil]
MDPRYAGETLKHLEKEYELLMEAYNSMSHELHTLQVEEEMLMRKFYELMTARGQTESVCSEEVEYIRDELERMIAFLGVADSMEEKDAKLKVWVGFEPTPSHEDQNLSLAP